MESLRVSDHCTYGFMQVSRLLEQRNTFFLENTVSRKAQHDTFDSYDLSKTAKVILLHRWLQKNNDHD